MQDTNEQESYDKRAYLRALEILNDEIKLNPHNYELYAQRARLHALHHQHSSALADYSAAIIINSSELALFEDRGNIYELVGQYEQAVNDYSYVLSTTQDTKRTTIKFKGNLIEVDDKAQIYKRRGNCYFKLAHYVEAASDYSKSLEMDPRDNTLARAKTYFMMGRFLQAIADFDAFFERAKTASPERIEAYILRGSSYFNLGEYYKAIADFDIVLDISRRWFKGYKACILSSYLNKGFAYRKLGDYVLSNADMEKAFTFMQEEVKVHDPSNSKPELGQSISIMDIVIYMGHESSINLLIPNEDELIKWFHNYNDSRAK